MRADGAMPERVLVPPEPGANTLGAIGDATLLWSDGIETAPTRELWGLPLSGDRKPFPYLPRLSGCRAGSATLSPNGRWLAYMVNYGRVNQVIVQSFPDPSQGRLQISSKGGAYPRWSRGGRELFYIESPQTLVAVPVVTDGPFKVLQTAELFAGPSPYMMWRPGGIVSVQRIFHGLSQPGANQPCPELDPGTEVIGDSVAKRRWSDR